MSKTKTLYFQKLLRKFKRLEARRQEPLLFSQLKKLNRKLDILARRIVRLNKQWKLGVAAATLTAFLGMPQATQAQLIARDTVELGELTSFSGFTLGGFEDYSYVGFSVAPLGDVNGDGIDDILIGSYEPDETPAGLLRGEAYVVFGSTMLPDSLSTEQLDGSNGFLIQGPTSVDGDLFGGLNANGGDINGDGLNDIILTAPYDVSDSLNHGKVYVLFGKNTAFDDTVTTAAFNGTDGFIINGSGANTYFGASIDASGDFNNDGIDDILVGAPGADRSSQGVEGRAYVVFGKNTGFGSSVDLNALTSSTGMVIQGGAVDMNLGISTRSAGDFNDDGIDDMILGTDWGDDTLNVGTAYVVFGSGNSLPDTLNVEDLNGTNGVEIIGDTLGSWFGRSVDGIEDFNGDGIDDVIIGAPDANTAAGNFSGKAFVVFGSSSLGASLDVNNLNGANGFRVDGDIANGSLGWSVAGAGDNNGDGLGDIVIGAYYADPGPSVGEHAGMSYVIFGTSNNLGTNFPLINAQNLDGFKMLGAEFDYSGFSVASAGDFNGDGFQDVMVGAPFSYSYSYSTMTSTDYMGKAYVVFGRDISGSVDEELSADMLRCYPNPTTDQVQVEIDDISPTDQAQIELFDLAGKRMPVSVQKQAYNHFQLDIGELSKGFYIISVTWDDNQLSQRIVKR